MSTAQELVDSGLTGVELSEAIWKSYDAQPESEKEHLKYLRQKVTATVWHGTRRREPIEELKKYGFCSYTEKQAGQWLEEAHRRLMERTQAGPRVRQRMEKHKNLILSHVKEPWRGKFSVTGFWWAACGEGEDRFTGESMERQLDSGWADRNPEFVWDYLFWRANKKVTDQILTEMFGKPIKVKLKVKVELRQLLNPQDMHLEQRCFTPEEILSIEPCPPKTAKQLDAEIDLLWAPFVQYAPSWVSRKMKDMELRQGKCYELAWRYVAFGDEGTLVHGEVWSHKLGRMMGHAWVITQTGLVYEPVSDVYFPKDALYKTFKLKEINTYTPTEARKITLETKHYGPWTDEERRKVVPQTTGGSKVRELLFSKKEDAEQSVEDYMAILPSDLRDKRVSRVWFDPSVGYWRAGIYIKEVINPEVAPQVGSQDNLLQYYKVPPGAS